MKLGQVRVNGVVTAALFEDRQIRVVPGVRSTETFTYLRIHKETYQWGAR